MDARILLFCTLYKPFHGGSQEMSYQLALSLIDAKATVTVVAPQGNFDEFDSVQPFETLRSINLGGRSLSDKIKDIPCTLNFYNHLKSLIEKKSINYLLVTHAGHYQYITGWLHGLLLHNLNLPTGVIFHGKELTILGALPRVKKWMFFKIVKGFTDYFSNSRYTADLAFQTLRIPRRPVVIGCGVRTDGLQYPISRKKARTELGIRSKYVLLTVGRLSPHKGIDNVIRALPAVLSHFPDLEYVVAGNGSDLARLQKIVKNIGVPNKVRFVGSFSDESKALFYCAANIFVMPSRFIAGKDVEGFGISFAEAGFYKLPVIGGASGGVPDAVIDGQTGFLVDPMSPCEISKSILRLLRDPELRDRLGEAGRYRANNELSWNSVVERLLTEISHAF